MTGQLLGKRSGLHSQTDAVIHKPSGLLGNSQVTRNLVRTDSVFAVHDHPDRSKPLVQTKRGILEYSSDLCRELALLVRALTLPLVLLFKKRNIIATTGRTRYAIRPSASGQILKAILRVRKVNNCLLKRLGFGLICHDVRIVAWMA